MRDRAEDDGERLSAAKNLASSLSGMNYDEAGEELAHMFISKAKNYQTRICTHWQRGACYCGRECTFAHGYHELQASDHNAAPPRLAEELQLAFTMGTYARTHARARTYTYAHTHARAHKHIYLQGGGLRA